MSVISQGSIFFSKIPASKGSWWFLMKMHFECLFSDVTRDRV